MKAKHVFLTLGLSLTMGLGVAAAFTNVKEVKHAEALSGGGTVYLLPGVWTTANARFAIYTWSGTDTNPTWTDMEPVATTNLYSATIPTGAEKIIFGRMNPGTTTNDWSNVWTQSPDLVLADSDGNTYYVDGSDWDTRGWKGLYDPSDEPTQGDGYYIVGTESSWTFTGATKMITCDESSENYAELIQYGASANEQFKVRSFFDGFSRWHGASNYEVGASEKKINVYLSKDGNIYVADYVAPDVPAEEGYYLQSSEGESWRFEDAVATFEYNGGTAVDGAGNIAILQNYHAVVGEEVKVHKYISGAADWVNVASGQNYEFGTDDADEEHTPHVTSLGNFMFTTAGYYDFYIQSDGSVFYISTHIERETVNFYGVLFAGRQKLSEAGHPTLVASEQVEVPAGNYNPADPSYAGHSRTSGPYTSEDLSELYTPAPLADELDLYYRYDQFGTYLMGDEAFTGSNATAWQIEGALISSAVSNPENVYEAVVTAPAGVSSSNPMSVKPYILDNNPGTPDWIDNCVIGLDSYSSFARMHTAADEDYGNIEITAPGTYAVYVKPEVRDEQNVFAVYFNEASADVDTFVGNFLTEIGGICSELGTTKTLQDLKDKWGEMKTAYNALGGAEKAVIYAVGFSGGSETGDALHQMVAKYARIVSKYGTANFEDFIWGQTISSNRVGNLMNTDSMALIVTLVSVTTIVASAALVMFLLKKKKYSK